MVEWNPLILDDRELVRDFFTRFPPNISEHTFANLFAWAEHRPVAWAVLDDALCVVQEPDGDRSLLGPLRGDLALADAVDRLVEEGIKVFGRLPEEAARELEERGLEVVPDRDNSDYVYRREDLAELAGRDYHREKNLVNRCLSRYDCEYEEVTADNLDEVAEMQDRWCDEKDCGEDRGLCAEYRAIRRTLEHYGALDLIGAAVRIEGRIEAYSVGEVLRPDTGVVHFEKAMTEFDGLYQVINQWFCRDALPEVEFVNREQDLGIPGLRRAKESYNPHHMVDKYVAGLDPVELKAADEGRCPEQN